MNIAVVNFSGNVGKTTIVRHLLAPNLPDHTIVAVETIKQRLEIRKNALEKARKDRRQRQALLRQKTRSA